MPHVLLYIANLIGYARVLLAIAAFAYFRNPLIFGICYSLSYFLDCLDGHYARKFKQVSQFGAMLDMMTDRACTISLLVMLSLEIQEYNAYFISMALLDMASHWMQMASSVITGVASHKGKAPDETFFVSLYYTVPGLLFVCVTGAEAYLILLYVYSRNNNFFNCPCAFYPFIVCGIIFHFKQVINVSQLYGSARRYIRHCNKQLKQ